MRVVVAGARGFIGRAVTGALTAASHEVVELELGDRVEELARSPDAIVWAAGRREPELAANRAVHVDAAVAAVRALQPSRVIYLSTGECYGDAPLPYREVGPALGTSPYAVAKLEGERALTALTAEFVASRLTVLRVGVAYGPGQAPSMLIPQVVEALRAGRRIGLTHGTQTRDFVFVDDVAGAVVAALSPRGPAPVVNIGSGVECTVRDVVREIARSLGAPESLLGFGDIAPRTGEAPRYVLDVSLAERVLGWRATTSLAEGVGRL